MNHPTRIFIHCSATEDKGDRFGAQEIDRWHKERGWKMIGYHYVIRRGGDVEIGRPENVFGAHARGHNRNTLGVCLVGTRIFTGMQIEALKTLYVKALYKRYKIPPEQVIGHYEVTKSKPCPNIPMALLRQYLRVELNLYHLAQKEVYHNESRHVLAANYEGIYELLSKRI